MPLEIPNLDDRRFQDLVDEARRLIPHYCPRWTDHNLSDPGITLIELFATLVETLIYRLNRVPEKSYITFMELMGVQLEPPAAARAQITFWLSGELFGPEAEPKLVPMGTEVAIEQSGATEMPISFSTDADLLLRPPRALAFLVSPAGGSQFENHIELLLTGAEEPEAVQHEPVALFSKEPRPSDGDSDGDSFYFGDENDLSGHVLKLTFKGPIEGVGIDPRIPPLRWEAWCGEQLGWREAELEGKDDTGGLNKEGSLVVHLPTGMARREYRDSRRRTHSGYWLRCQYIKPRAGQPGYSASPRILTLQVVTLGGTTSATHSTTIVGEMLGRSNGKPGQQFRLEYMPVLRRRAGETLEVQGVDDNWVAWSECEHFGGSQHEDTHFTLDDVSGLVSFGPLIREPDGRERQYGMIPHQGQLIRFTRYRRGGGAEGNVGAGTLKVLKSTLPYVDRVANRKPANGGLDAESLERAKLRAPQMLRTRERAVTAEDYEYLAVAAGQGIKRARCLVPGDSAAGGTQLPPGVVRLLLVPAKEPAEGPITEADLLLAEEARKEIEKYLDDRRLLTTVVRIDAPQYVRVTVTARLKRRTEAQQELVQREALARLYKFLNPLVGGTAGEGWPFGRALFISEVYAALQSTPGVEYVEGVDLQIGDQRDAVQRVEVPLDGLLISGIHHIVFTAE